MKSRGDPLPLWNREAAQVNQRQAVLILGMHRTGTSALTGVIHMLGARPPAQLQPGNSFNERGYWESKAVVRLNDRILSAGGSQWRDWTAFEENRMSPEDRARLESEVTAVIAAEYGDAHLIALKDPRMCRIVPLWIRGLDRANIALRFVISIRNPLESALSLLQRDNIPVAEGLLLWLRHLLDAERQTRGRVRCFVSFDHLLTDWQAVANRISESLGVAWPQQPAAVETMIDDFIRGELRHYERSQGDLETHADVAGWIVETYDILLKLQDGANIEDQMARLDSIHRAFDQGVRAFKPLIRYRDEKAMAAASEISELRHLLERAEAEAASEISELRHLLERAEAELVARTQSLLATANELESLQTGSTLELVRARVELYKKSRKPGTETLISHLIGRLRNAFRGKASRRQQREAEQAELIRASGLFDAEWYLQLSKDARHAHLDPVIHYLRHGASEGLDPSPKFSSTAYRQRYLDVASAGVNPLVHFLNFGLDEQRQIAPASMAKRELIAGTDKSYVRRNKLGTSFVESDDCPLSTCVASVAAQTQE